MRNLLILTLALILGCGWQAVTTPPPISIPVLSPTFAPTGGTLQGYHYSSACGGTLVQATNIPGWTFGSNAGAFQFASPNSCGATMPPGQTTVAYAAYGGSFQQVLDATPKVVQAPSPGWQYSTEGVYMLKFSIANYFPTYPGYWKATITYGTQQLCDPSGWGTLRWHEVVAMCPAPNYIVIYKSLDENGNSGTVQGTLPFILHFTVGGWPVMTGGPVTFEFQPDGVN